MNDCAADDSECDAIRDGIGECHHGHADEARNGIRQIRPVDLRDLLNHQEADDDECRCCCKARNGEEERSQEERRKEQNADRAAGQTGSAAFGDTGRRFHKGCDRGSSAACTSNGTDGISEQDALDFRELAILVEHVCLGSTADDGSDSIEDIDEQEGNHNSEEVQEMAADKAEVKLHERAGHGSRSRENRSRDD